MRPSSRARSDHKDRNCSVDSSGGRCSGGGPNSCQTRAVFSELTLIRLSPAGEKVIDSSQPMSMGERYRSLPVAVSHKRIGPRVVCAANVLPSGENADSAMEGNLAKGSPAAEWVQARSCAVAVS